MKTSDSSQFSTRDFQKFSSKKKKTGFRIELACKVFIRLCLQDITANILTLVRDEWILLSDKLIFKSLAQMDK